MVRVLVFYNSLFELKILFRILSLLLLLLHFCTLIHNEETLSGSLLIKLEFSEIKMEATTPHPFIAICGDTLS